MNWTEFKNAFEREVAAKKAKSPKVYLSSFRALEKNIEKYYPDIIKKPSLLLVIDREDFKAQMAKCKESGRLNAAEASVINVLYTVIKN